MQSLDIISINIWQILISLCNLVILFLILKKFLYKPVRSVLAQRRAALDQEFAAAEADRDAAAQSRAQYDEKLRHANEDAEAVRAAARQSAEYSSRQILADAQDRSEGILRRAQQAAEQEKKRAEMDIRDEIADVSMQLTEKLLDREITAEDHRALIDDFLKDLGEDDDADR